MFTSLESVLCQCTATPNWKHRLGDAFPLVSAHYFRRLDEPASAIRCDECLCGHEVITHPDGLCVGVCTCDEWCCDNMILTPEDITLWELNWTRLGRALARAFDCDFREAEFGVRRTRQIATYGGAELPVILTIAHDRQEFRYFVTELVARFRSGFILLAPTAQFVTVQTRELLGTVKAGFFDLETYARLVPDGSIAAVRPGLQLFSPYMTRQVEPPTEGEINRVFGLLKTFDAGPKRKKAPLEQVFRKLVLQGHSQADIAEHSQCSLALINLRVAEIERRTRRSLQDLRLFATQLAESEPAARSAKTPVRGSDE